MPSLAAKSCSTIHTTIIKALNPNTSSSITGHCRADTRWCRTEPWRAQALVELTRVDEAQALVEQTREGAAKASVEHTRAAQAPVEPTRVGAAHAFIEHTREGQCCGTGTGTVGTVTF